MVVTVGYNDRRVRSPRKRTREGKRPMRREGKRHNEEENERERQSAERNNASIGVMARRCEISDSVLVVVVV